MQETVGGGLVKMLLLAVFVIVCSLVSGHMDDLIESLIFDGRVEYQIQVIYRGVVIRVGDQRRRALPGALIQGRERLAVYLRGPAGGFNLMAALNIRYRSYTVV